MIYAVLSGAYETSFLSLAYLTLLLVGCGTLMMWLHAVLQSLVVGQSVKNLFSALWKDPNTYLSLVGFALFGIGWFRTVPHNRDTRGKRFFVGVSGPLFCLAVSVLSLLMINVTNTLPVFYLLFKVLFRVSAYGALFSLLPMTPYDGGEILLSVMPSKWQDGFRKSGDFSVIIMIAAALTLTVLGKIPMMAL